KIIQAISANEKFQNVQGGLANDFDNFRQSVIRSLAALGRSIAESINLSGILEKLSSFLERVTKRFESLSITTQRFIVIGAGIAVVIGPVITVLGVLAKAFVFILPAIKAVGIALAVLATPVGAAVAAIGFFTAAISVAYKGSKEFRATIAGVIEVIKKFAADAVRALTLPVRALTDLLRGDLQSAQQKVKQVLGIESGENAGEAFARAYNSSIAKSIAEETSRRVSRQTGRRGRLGGTTQAEIEQLRIGGQSSESQADLSKIFANLPTSTTSDQNPIRKSNEEFEKQSRLLGDIIAHELNLQRIREGIPANFQVTNQAIESLSATTQGLTAELTKPIEELGIRFQELPNQLSPAQESLVEYGNALAAINDRSVAFGSTFDVIGEKISATRQAIDQAFADGFTSASENVQALVEELNKLTFIESITNGIGSLGDEIENLAQRGALSFKSFANAALNAISNIIGALIKQGVAAAITGSIQTAPGPIGLALA
ncbi:MAG: hypothetical protein AAGL17_15235, partial [Cyanobacteria bacterium J06576_12]